MTNSTFTRLLKKANIQFNMSNGEVTAQFENEHYYLEAKYDYINQICKVDFICNYDKNMQLTEEQNEQLFKVMHAEYESNEYEYNESQEENNSFNWAILN